MWHEQRVLEIESSYDFGEIDKATYLELKSAADQTRMDYQKAQQDRLVYDSRYRYYPFGFHGFYHHHHHHR
jgi:hypothetical protein